jgi:hypothetical protein
MELGICIFAGAIIIAIIILSIRDDINDQRKGKQ